MPSAGNYRNFIVFSFFFAFLLTFSPSLQAQVCEPGVTQCASDADCQQVCPTCYTCEGGLCMADDTVCQAEEGACRLGTCQDPPDANLPLGCDFDAAALEGVLGLEDICYICAPPAVAGVNTCGNGICDEGDGEDCQSCPADCLVPGFAGDCPSQTEADSQCVVPNTFCTNGEICDQGLCLTALACDVNPRSCSGDTNDLCCASGCQGPPDGLNCAEAEAQGIIPAGQCDVDCWPAPDCGDGLVENPETCEATAALGPGGVPVVDADCRAPGSVDQCTFCGDGIIQADAGEVCDGENADACGGAGCNPDCTCDFFCISGSGGPFSTIREGCANCSFNPWASSNGPLRDYGIFLSLVVLTVLGGILRCRLRRVPRRVRKY